MAESVFMLKRDEILPYIKIEGLRGKKATDFSWPSKNLTQHVTLDLAQFADGCKNSLMEDPRHYKSTPLLGQFQLQMKKNRDCSSDS